MTAQEFVDEKTAMHSPIIKISKGALSDLLKEFAILKCAEQRKICFENAVGQIDFFRNFEDYQDVIIDEDSILNSPNPEM